MQNCGNILKALRKKSENEAFKPSTSFPSHFHTSCPMEIKLKLSKTKPHVVKN